VLNTFHMELVHNDHYCLGLACVDLPEEILITIVNKDMLKSWEEDSASLDEPVNLVRIKASLRKLGRLTILHSAFNFIFLLVPEANIFVGNSLIDVLWHVHSCLVHKSQPCLLIEFRT